MSIDTLFCKIPKCSTTGQILTLGSRFTFTSWQKFYSLTPNLAILTKKSLTVSKVYQRILTPFQNHLWTILEGDTPGRRAWETIWIIGSQGTFTKLWTLGAVNRSSELLGRGMRWWRRVQTEPGEKGHKIGLLDFSSIEKDLATPRFINPWRRNWGRSQ